jgi:hypothetical protein
MARTSKTANGRSKVAMASTAAVASRKVMNKTSFAAPKRGTKSSSPAAVDEERPAKIPRVATSKNKASSGPPSSSLAPADAVVPKARSRAALRNISTNHCNKNNKVDYPVDDNENKICKTIEKKKKEGTTKKKTTTAATTARDGQSRASTADAIVDEEEDGTTTTGSESDTDEDEGESDYEEPTMASKKTKTKTTKTKAASKASDATSEKKNGRDGGAIKKSSSSASRGRGEKTTNTAAARAKVKEGGVFILKATEKVVVDTGSTTEVIMMPNVTRKFAKEDTNGVEFDNVHGGYVHGPTTNMYEEEYRANSNDDWRCMSAVDW